MNYTLHQLQVFLKVTQAESITKAAEELHLSQPAVSIQLKNFQDQFEIPLTEVIGQPGIADTGGGTSDGRFLAPAGAQVVELGPVNESIHQVNEWVQIDALEPLAKLYQRSIEGLLLEIGAPSTKV